MLISNSCQIKVCFMLVPVSRMVNLASVELIGELMSPLTLIRHFLLTLDNFQNAYLTSIIRISAKSQSKVKTNISKFKLAHW